MSQCKGRVAEWLDDWMAKNIKIIATPAITEDIRASGGFKGSRLITPQFRANLIPQQGY